MLVALRVLLVVAVFVSICETDRVTFATLFIGHNHSVKVAELFASDIVDVPPLLQRLSACRSIENLPMFWHGYYTIGTPFYRPLSLTALWLEYHFLGTSHYERWLAVSIVLQLLLCTLLGVFLLRLTGSWAMSMFSVLVFAGYRNWPPLGPALEYIHCVANSPSLVAATEWKNQPTQLCDCATLLALIFAQNRRWIAALFVSVIAVLFKEAGWIVYALTAVFLLGTGQIRFVPKWVYPAVIVSMAVPMVARYSSGMGLIGGLRIGSNHNWLVRYALSTGGAYVVSWMLRTWPAALFATLAYIIYRAEGIGPIVRLLLSLVAAMIATVAESHVEGIPLSVAFVVLFDPQLWFGCIAGCIVFMAASEITMRNTILRKPACVLTVLMLISALPYVGATQVSSHALELCYVFQSSLVGLAIVAMIEAAKSKLSRNKNIPGVDAGDLATAA
jgi:hypothetical protein